MYVTNLDQYVRCLEVRKYGISMGQDRAGQMSLMFNLHLDSMKVIND